MGGESVRRVATIWLVASSSRNAVSRFSARRRKTPFGNCAKYASKSAGFVLFMIDYQNRFSCTAVAEGDCGDAAVAASATWIRVAAADCNAVAAGPSR